VSVEDVLIRDATNADAVAMGRLHVRAWQGAYRGVMPDEYLDDLEADDRIAFWRGRVSPTDLPPILVAVVTGEVVGFAAFGEEQGSTHPGECGELYAMNIDPAHWRRGIGRALLRDVTEALVASGYPEAVLWVVPENERARGLYESEGWTPDGAISADEILGVTVTNIRYRKSLIAERPHA